VKDEHRHDGERSQAIEERKARIPRRGRDSRGHTHRGSLHRSQVGAQQGANCPALLAELRHPEEALERAGALAAAAEVTGDTHSLSELRAVELASRLAHGEQAALAEADWLIETAGDRRPPRDGVRLYRLIVLWS
jgi:hypothetical protein